MRQAGEKNQRTIAQKCMGATIKDVARLADVSIATVSRVLNKTAPVNEDKRVRVEAAISQLGYRPNPAARRLLRQETGGFGVLIPSLGGEFFAGFLKGLDEEAQRSGFFCLIGAAHRSEAELDHAIRQMHGRVDGIVIMSPGQTAEKTLQLIPQDMPVVFLNTSVSDPGIPYLNFDNHGGAFRMVQHMADLGHQRIAMIKGPASAYDAEERLRGYREALQVSGLSVNPALEFEGNFTEEWGYHAGKAILASPLRPTAVFAANDFSAFGAMSAFQEEGLRIPEDIALSGFDDISITKFTTPPLSSVRVPTVELGRRTMKTLIGIVRNIPQDVMTPDVLPTELVIRRSTDPGA